MAYFSKKQAEAFAAEPRRWNLHVGATSSGKTYGSFHTLLKRMRKQPPGLCLLIGNTLGSLVRNVVDPMRELFGPEYVVGPYGRFNKVRLFGRECYTVSAHDESSYKALQGPTVAYAYGDEFGTWPESVMQWLKSRLRVEGACFDGTANPEGPLHWAKTDWIDRAADMDLAYYHYVLDDNPFLPPDYVRELKREYTGVWYQRLILGLWVAAEGTIYDMLHGDSHVVDQLPRMQKYWAGLDYGPGSVSTLWVLGFGTDNRLYFTHRWRWEVGATQRQLADSELAARIDDWLSAIGVAPDYLIIPRDAASLGACLSLQMGQWKQIRNIAWADQSPGTVLQGIQQCSTLFATGMLRFARGIEQAGGMREWVGYSWNSKASRDEPTKQDDHDPDAGRYVVMATRSFWRPALQEMLRGEPIAAN